MLKQPFKRIDKDTTEPDGFVLNKDDPYYDYHLLISDYLRTFSSVPLWSFSMINTRAEEQVKALLNSDRKAKVRLVIALSIRLDCSLKDRNKNWQYLLGFKQLLTHLLRPNLPFTEEELTHILQLVTAYLTGQSWFWPTNSLLRQVDYLLNGQSLTPLLYKTLLEWLSNLENNAGRFHEKDKLKWQLEILLGQRLEAESVEAGEAWTDAILADLKKLSHPVQKEWAEIFIHASKARATRPNLQWTKNAGPILDRIGRETFRQSMLAWLPLVDKDRSQIMSSNKADILKGLVWFCGLYEGEAMKRLVADVALGCFHKVPQYGERSRKVGNACVQVLGNMRAIGELAQLRLRIKNRRTQNIIAEVLETAAREAGMTTAELEELSVPTFGLTEPGLLALPAGEFTAELRIEGQGTTLWWGRPDGKLQKSVPAAVKREHSDLLSTLKRSQKDIQKMLPVQRTRVENLLAARDHCWDFESWRERYLDHPLLATIARRLIWQFEQGGEVILGIWYEGQLVDVNDQPLASFSDKTAVRLWHPLGSDINLIREWRAWLLFHEVRQPFKQAHREIYLLTDAELRTDTYSNRFAAHLLRQHQFNALCLERGWHYRLGGGWDGGYDGNATLYRPDWGIIAQYWVQTVQSDDWHIAYSNSGVALFVSTDQVRFYNQQMELLSLEEVPARLFSEVMRDVDLFVGVCSVGNDPSWEDRGGLPGFGDYWQSYAFGSLSASAATRREVLQSLIPRLKIASRCSLVEKFLVVEGHIRTYKIHLGSGNILMEPNNQYLCIVPDRRGTAVQKATKVFLPFDGDALTSLILSKAFLLAEDDKISDKTIVSQIRPGGSLLD